MKMLTVVVVVVVVVVGVVRKSSVAIGTSPVVVGLRIDKMRSKTPEPLTASEHQNTTNLGVSRIF
jgi:hypothetical protein